jgi:hypothetical protein
MFIDLEEWHYFSRKLDCKSSFNLHIVDCSKLASRDPENSLHYRALGSSSVTQTLRLMQPECSELYNLIFRQ